jgi:hypothetical protein
VHVIRGAIKQPTQRITNYEITIEHEDITVYAINDPVIKHLFEDTKVNFLHDKGRIDTVEIIMSSYRTTHDTLTLVAADWD